MHIFELPDEDGSVCLTLDFDFFLPQTMHLKIVLIWLKACLLIFSVSREDTSLTSFDVLEVEALEVFKTLVNFLYLFNMIRR